MIIATLLIAVVVQVTDAPFAMPPIPEAVIPARNFPITDYGAKADGSNCRAAFAAAVKACAAAGGGRIVVPRGQWVSGAIALASNCTLHLEEGAEVVFTQNPADYLPAVHTSWEGVECFNYSPCVYAYGATNVAITGKGTLRGFSGDYPKTLWRTWARPYKGPIMDSTKRLYEWMSDGVPVEKRRLTDFPEPRTRPHLVQFFRCRNVLMDGFTVRESPFWTLHVYRCENVVARHLDVEAHGHNTDGIDLESSRNCLVEDSRFNQGDDGFVIKSGRNRDGWELAGPTENVVIRRCHVERGHTLLGLGSELSGGIRNVALYDCTVGRVYKLFFVKTNPRRGGFVENVSLKGVKTRDVDVIVALGDNFYSRWKAFPDRELRPTRIRGLRVSDVTCEVADRMIDLQGPPACPARDIRISNVFCGKVRKEPFVVRQTEDIRCENVRYRDATGREGRADAARGYLDLAETAIGAYDATRLESYTREAETLGVREHGFPRLAANLAQLVAAGRLPEKKPLLARMMTAACASAKKGKMPPKSGGNEFSVRELVMAVVALERARLFPPETIAAWKADLTAVDAYACYTTAKTPLGLPIGKNWPLFGAASEQARLHYGLGGDPKFVETWVSDQLRHFDQNGMYRDPHEPSVYDFVGRICFMAILHFGYDGPCRAQVEEKLLLSAEPTLAMLSVAGEMPYGGRSNQFLHNNTLYAGVAEWYAALFAKRGDAARAARFRAAAARAVEALEPWLKGGEVFHVKNRYPRPETKDAWYLDQKWFGCENYAYFDKYMITMGSWAVLAREFAEREGRGHRSRSTMDGFSSQSNNQTIKQSSNSIIQPSTFTTSEPFHWKFTNSRTYTVQEDWRANPQYDATGIGRIHRRGAPPAICLSAPFAAEPHYFIGGGKNPGPLAIAAEGGKMTYEVSDAGVEIRVAGENGKLTLPVFEFDGAEATRIEMAEHLVKVSYCGWVCRYETSDGAFADTGLKYHNRNGRYRRIDCTGRDFRVHVTIETIEKGYRFLDGVLKDVR